MEATRQIAKRLATLQRKKEVLERQLDKSYAYDDNSVDSLVLESRYVRLSMKIDALMRQRIQLL